ncbi:hypothetical protein BGZ47_007576 [Haplosporangium gracile]|nr:hypothetical protein BGZ47_007576 [Haplosporangium gracile]
MAGTQTAFLKYSELSLKRQHISEILEHILAFLSLKDRQIAVQFVCKQWHSICKSLAPTWATRYVHDNLSSQMDPSYEDALANEVQVPMTQLRISNHRFIQLGDQQPIIDLIGTHYPIPKKLYFSAHDKALTDWEVTLILEHFPNFEEYSFSNRDAGQVLLAGLRTVVANRVTTLNLLTIQVHQSTRLSTLRDILCTFTHLIHLRAPSMEYYHEDMDVNDVCGQIHARWNPSRFRHQAAMTEGPNDQYIWACRGLRTLHMTVGGHSGDTNSSYNALIMFGFLNRQCPQLQGLHLRRTMVDLSFKGGLCLLTRLQELERVKITTGSGYELDEQALFWLRTTPWTIVYINYPLFCQKLRHQSELTGPRPLRMVRESGLI